MRSRVTPCRTVLTINLPASSAVQTTLRLSVTLPKNPLYVSRDLKYSPVSDNMMKLKMKNNQQLKHFISFYFLSV